jgi:hypothetical protein
MSKHSVSTQIRQHTRASNGVSPLLCPEIMYDTAQNQLLSYFRICGIHGRPYVKWNDSVDAPGGYCVHGTVLFPTWHRPYVALFEVNSTCDAFFVTLLIMHA